MMNGVPQTQAGFAYYPAQSTYKGNDTAREESTTAPVLDLAPLYQNGTVEKETDVFRDTGLRYLGYANDFGEAFRSIIGPVWAHRTYWIAGAYAAADSLSKGKDAFKEAKGESFHDRVLHFLGGVLDAGVFHFIASITVPPMIIRALQEKIVGSMPQRMAKTAIGKSLPVAAGLAIIPLIVKPVDWAAEKFLDMTIRPALGRPNYFHDSHKHEAEHHKRMEEAKRQAPLINAHPVQRSAFFDNTFA